MPATLPATLPAPSPAATEAPAVAPPGGRSPAPVETRVRRLSNAASRRVIEPDTDVPGAVGPGQIIPDEFLSIAGLDLDLTPAQKATLSREEVASVTRSGIRFEAVLEAGFALEIAGRLEIGDPRMEFLLHEIGEETRHQRLFLRLYEQLDPQAVSPLDRPAFRFLFRRQVNRIVNSRALLYTLVLGGEEIPDLLQKLVSEHPDSDPFLRQVNLYHRQEEARHLSYARAVLPEIWAKATPLDRMAVHRIAPKIIGGMFDMLVHPGVYATVGLPTWETWKRANRSPARVAMRHEATRPVLRALIDAGAVPTRRVPRGWRELCGVDCNGDPIAA